MKNEQSPREQVVRGVIRGLYEGQYRPGQRLVEAMLTKTYGVSRGPVREGLNRLAAIGVVTLTLQRGAQVRRMTRQEAIDILTVVEPLVGVAARLAATRIKRPGAARKLKDALARLVAFDASSTSADYAIARERFYGTLTNIAGNGELRRILPSVQIHLVRIQFREAISSAGTRRHADYRRIASAVLRGQPAAAEKIAREHVGRALAALRRPGPD